MKRNLTLHYILLISYTIIAIVPLIWLVWIAVSQTNESIFFNFIGIPERLHFENFLNAWNNFKMGRFLLNTFFIATAATIVTLLFTVFSSFIIARFKFRFKGFVYYYLLAGISLPAITAIYPLFISAHKINALNSYWLLITVYAGWAVSICILILVGFMRNIPKEFEEAAAIDGANMFHIFVKIIVPLSKPAIFTVTTLIYLLSFWNEFILAATLITDPIRRTINVSLASAVSVRTIQYVDMIAAVVIVLVPVIAFFLIFQRFIVSGLTLGGIKE